MHIPPRRPQWLPKERGSEMWEVNMVITENTWGMRARANQRELKINCRGHRKSPEEVETIHLKWGHSHWLGGLFRSISRKPRCGVLLGSCGKSLVREQLQTSARGAETILCDPPHPLLSSRPHSRAFFLYPAAHNEVISGVPFCTGPVSLVCTISLGSVLTT